MEKLRLKPSCLNLDSGLFTGSHLWALSKGRQARLRKGIQFELEANLNPGISLEREALKELGPLWAQE